MPTDKVLHRIQDQINELAPTLELFVDDTIQPSVNDCELLQKQLSDLQENLAVYKYQKQMKELSPSFAIHAKLNEKVETEEKLSEASHEIKEEFKVRHEKPEARKEESGSHKTESEKSGAPLLIGINDKFRFMNELFAQNSSEYNIAIEQLTNVTSWNEAEIYLNSLKNVYGWKDNMEVVKYFYAVVKKRFA